MEQTNKVLFPGVQDGATFMVGGIEFIKFPDQDGMTPVLTKNIAFFSSFGGTNNLAKSQILTRMREEFLPQVVEVVGEEKICTFKTDLTTWDGLKNYGELESKGQARGWNARYLLFVQKGVFYETGQRYQGPLFLLGRLGRQHSLFRFPCQLVAGSGCDGRRMEHDGHVCHLRSDGCGRGGCGQE